MNDLQNLAQLWFGNPLCSDDRKGSVWYAEHAMEKTLRVMIVDDNSRARGALSAFLSTMESVQVVGEASNGEEAIEKAERVSPDVILLDIQMPVMDGVQATQVIKQKWPYIRVIATTIHVDYESQAKRAGADAFLVKGCSAEELKSAILPSQPGEQHPARICHPPYFT